MRGFFVKDQAPQQFLSTYAPSATILADYNNLWNGNIGMMHTHLPSPGEGPGMGQNPTEGEAWGMLGTVYQYDQLNRLISGNAYQQTFDEATGQWTAATETAMYNNQFTYDANGNILTQQRSDQSGEQFEDLAYNYNAVDGKMLQNRLYGVNELGAVSTHTDDIEDQGTFVLTSNNGTPNDPTDDTNINVDNNYGYTEIGELLRDNAEQIEQIVWRVDSKIAYIYRDNNSTEKELGFSYDAMGNRIAKHIYSATGVFEKSTYYVRDASGNTMSTYESKEEPEGEWSYMLIERHIYGSSRLGMDIETVELVDPIPTTQYPIQRTLGRKQYELSNHLGNVLTVINDIKLPVVDEGVIVSYTAVVISATDYSAFGVALYGRSYTTEAYRYGFNGQEKEKEITGTETHTSAEFWMYDSRLGRRWEIDPRQSVSQSPYVAFSNSPILFCDPFGDTVWVFSEQIVSDVSGSGVPNGRHMFMRVKTDCQDVIIELYGPDGGPTGRPQVNQSDASQQNRNNLNQYEVERPINSPEGDYTFENALIDAGKKFKSGSVEVPDPNDPNNIKVTSNEYLPTYNALGPNSNGYVTALVTYFGGAIVVPSSLSILPGDEDKNDILPYTNQMDEWYAPCKEPIDLGKVDIQEKRDNTDTKYDKKTP